MSVAARVLFVTSEIAPWQKTGGLGDISAALPKALARAGVDVRVLIPAYPALLSAFPDATAIAEIPPPGGRLAASRLLAATTSDGLPLLLLDGPTCFERPGGPYQSPEGRDWPDNALRFGLLSRIAALLASGQSPLDWRPDVLHCNDWQSGLAPAYLRYLHHRGGGAATVMTIHNMVFQGLFPAQSLSDLGLPSAAFVFDGVEFHGHLSFLKAGLQFADRITTVSPTYAQEIQRPELGFGLDGLLRYRSSHLTGILNGVEASWNPATDPLLEKRYDARHLAAKEANRRALRAELGLADAATTPLLAIVSRLTHQKGMDLVLAIADRLLAEPAQLAVLGTGERRYEDGFRALAERNPGRAAAMIGFDENLAHRFEAGADIFLMPSRFEPCGLNQMYSLRYGTPPVVHASGGLADTVVDCTAQTLAEGSANGFSFRPADGESLLAAARRAITAWHQRKLWRRLQKNGMAADFSWDKAAIEYLGVYRAALDATNQAHGDSAIR